jgi:predicted transcriptional regulator
MNSHVPAVGPADSLDRVAALLADDEISAVPVVGVDGTVIGMISDDDLLRYRTTPGKAATGTAGAAMSEPAVSVPPHADVADVADTMLRHRINYLPVMEDDHLVGVVGRQDLLRLLTTSDTNLRREIQRRLDLYAGGHRWTVQIADRVAYITGDFHDEAERRTVTVLAATVPGVRDTLLRTAPGERIDCG